MEFFKANTKINFMGQRKIAALFSIIIFIASLAAIFTQGLTLGLDFTGGTQMDVSFKTPVNLVQLRTNLKEQGFTQAVVQSYTVRSISVRVGPHKELSQKEMRSKLLAAMPGATVGQLQFIGPQVSGQLLTNGVLAVLVVLLATMAYIAFRFDYRFAVSAALALIHDPLLILGVFAFFHLQFDMITLTALLTVIGYSLNDTIVVYDRVRENFRKVRKGTAFDIMNLSVNQTLSRTIMTSGLTLLVVIALFVWGGEMIHGFALAMIIGIVIGTYSSIYVASSMALALGMNRQSLMPVAKQEDDGMP